FCHVRPSSFVYKNGLPIPGLAACGDIAGDVGAVAALRTEHGPWRHLPGCMVVQGRAREHAVVPRADDELDVVTPGRNVGDDEVTRGRQRFGELIGPPAFRSARRKIEMLQESVRTVDDGEIRSVSGRWNRRHDCHEQELPTPRANHRTLRYQRFARNPACAWKAKDTMNT